MGKTKNTKKHTKDKVSQCNIGIPKELHFIWISKKEEEAKNIPDSFYKNAIKTSELAKKDGSSWTMTLWVDQSSTVLYRVKKLRKAGFKIKNIDKTNIFETDHTEKISDPSNTVYQKQIFDESYNLAIRVDILKYQILKKHGGIINDFNFVYERLPDNEELSNSLIVYKARKSFELESYMENCFMGSITHHEFIKEVQTGVTNYAAHNDYCLSQKPKFPEDILDMLKSGLHIQEHDHEMLSRAKQTYCSAVVTVDCLHEIDLSKFPDTIVTETFREYCYSAEHCFGHDSVYANGELSVESWSDL